MADLINGRAIAARLVRDVSEQVAAIVAQSGLAPGLAVVLVGSDAASEVYVARKIETCRAVGIRSIERRLPADTSQAELLSLIDELNADPTVHGILVQLPLPAPLDSNLVLDRIKPAKDVDGFHPVNVGRLSTGTGGLVPCTPLGCMMLLDEVIDDYRGLNAVVIGKSNIVGKPLALLLLERECTVTVTHIETRDLADIARRADIVVAAAGAPRLVRGYWVKEGAVVIDVGITRMTAADGKTKLVGDCATDELGHARAITPVPGGVGPMTIACLVANTVCAATLAAHG
ncbi:bifunctional 5,10-methylenetetrahydrofolate dehydrogenase/5,10-methenyltetrahydrofolate cyclohydrolase [Rhizorhabdus dicambivorans]|uniref:Bifunctional protein FolD n=2 Tax=Sphingomonadaceae TaxID=41297 RepID=A0A2A4FNN1_9SPHN|nr:bifunctional methylenetetrahydrofolate dehydrogenase/methenyltetrahydrofolate cyclohydrolase FolD [Rhizorhabdus dicambivorans]ALK02321.1 bifunctional 5,10-methenyl-THF dehydrogenase/5,10-methenyl-THF cyclohydrolase [Sphingomonas sp. Ndbn-20]ATE65738.1 bifunctional methylenetetrahydrofolate dehydrogenase/methenyltetrahydrofolate cyclohydrolase [Rhizorhabdus dicambivorans]PCE39699.1 bifunctional methylenetetrahydrofolate dehydrogenase/methenyltetrahydrofolate cyclohydrolase [Rhizorhabdus dicamb